MNLMEMKSTIILVTVVAFFAMNVNCRAIDEDNVIQSTDDSESEIDQQNWLKITKAPTAKVIHTPGNQIELECEIMGSPTPSIEWVDGNVQLTERDNYETNLISESTSTSIARVRSVLIIDNDELDKDRTFTCIGEAGGKYVSATTTVITSPVNGKPSKNLNALIQLSKKKPKIVYNYSLYLDQIGSNILLPCRISDHIRADVFWIDNNNQIVGKNPRIKILPTGELLITDLKWNDMGAYKCIAKNSFGKDHTETFVYPALKDE